MGTNKIIGYVLLAAGLAIIGLTLFQSYNIFTGKSSAPLVFKTPGLAQAPAAKAGGILDLQKQINEALTQQVGQMLPTDAITKILNLVAWSILASILIWGGGALAGLGIKMVK